MEKIVGRSERGSRRVALSDGGEEGWSAITHRVRNEYSFAGRTK